MANVSENACKIIAGKGLKCSADTCSKDTECCQEPKSNIITCCAKGSCNKNTGLCENKTDAKCGIKQAGIVIEKYGDDKKKKFSTAEIAGLCLVGLVAVFMAVMFFRSIWNTKPVYDLD